jgi:hypothetical protein
MKQLTKAQVFEFNEPLIPGAPMLVDDVTLAYRMGFQAKSLWYFIKYTEDQYDVHTIPKASGGRRLIHAPKPPIKRFLNHMRTRLLVGLCEQLGKHVVAYREGQGTRQAAELHLRPCPVCSELDTAHTCTYEVTTHTDDAGVTRYKKTKHQPECKACATVKPHACPRAGTKIKIDLKDFFNSTKPAWIREYFQTKVGYNRYVSGLLASVMTVPIGNKLQNRRGVPQGAPTSGDICNLVADTRLDEPLLQLLAGSDWAYTRYADDLYFSHPTKLDYQTCKLFLDGVFGVIKKSGWRINMAKLEVQSPLRQQRLLGMTINQKINVQRAQFNRLRTIVHRCFYDGFEVGAQLAKQESGPRTRSWIQGQISWFRAINPAKADQIQAVFDAARDRHGN